MCQSFIKIKQLAAMHAKMAQQRFCGQAGGSKEPVHLHLIWLHLLPERHICPERQLRHQMTFSQLNVKKSMVCHPGVCIYILHFQVIDDSRIMNTPRIACAAMISFQI
jgi:hypothetical protein